MSCQGMGPGVPEQALVLESHRRRAQSVTHLPNFLISSLSFLFSKMRVINSDRQL